MLSFLDPRQFGSRRAFLRVGSLALGGTALAGLPLRSALAAAEGLLTGRSVVLLFLHGGPSQIETFDPKLTAPSEFHSRTGEVSTKLPGVTFGGTFPRLASLADQLSIVRSFKTGDGNHDIKPVVSRDTLGANLGSIYARVAGANNPQTGLPTNVMLFPRAVDPTTQPGVMNFGRFDAVGTLGAGVTPFDPSGGGDLQADMKLSLAPDRLGDRRELLSLLDQARWALEQQMLSGLDDMRGQAFSTLLGGVADAFDLSHEDARTLERYDTAPRVRPESISRKWNNYNNYVDNAKSLGRLMLLARRLCERGSGFVTVTTNFVWDMHADSNNAGVAEGMGYMGLPLDHAVSAFIEDVAARGLSDRILLVCCGEMGRTPRVNDRGGRDHWGELSPLLLSGGGLPMGQVIGQSDRTAAAPQTDPVTIRHLIGTIMERLFDVGRLRIDTTIPRDIARTMAEWPGIPGLT